MPDLSPLFPAILAIHIALAVGLFLPSLLLPFTLASRSVAPGAPERSSGPLVRGMLWAQANGSFVIGTGLALTGIGLGVVIGPRILEQGWLLVSLATYAATAVIAFAVQRPGLRKLVAREGISGDADREAWRAGARRQRYLAYGITSAVGLIGFLMSTKPELW